MGHEKILLDHQDISTESPPDPRGRLGAIVLASGFGGLAMLLVLIEILRSAS